MTYSFRAVAIAAACFCATAEIAGAATIDFEASTVDILNVSPTAPYSEDGFTITPTNDLSAVFGSGSPNKMLGNTTNWFGFAESNTLAMTLTSGTGGLFDLHNFDGGISTIASGSSVVLTVMGTQSGGGILNFVSGSLSTSTNIVLNWTSLSSVTFSTSDDAGLDNISVSAVPIPASLPLLLAGLGGIALVSRRKRASRRLAT